MEYKTIIFPKNKNRCAKTAVFVVMQRKGWDRCEGIVDWLCAKMVD